MRHYLDGNAIAADRHYGQEFDDEGIVDGDDCNRWSEPDEDCPRPWRCGGTMAETDGGFVACDTCGQMPSAASSRR